jgi:FtsH-binding integral membrane protein
MSERGILTILVWGLILEIISVIHLSSTPRRFEFAYSVFLLIFTSIALVVVIWRLRASRGGTGPIIGE